MGFTTISLSPIMANAAKGYHGYWIEDYFRVEEELGTMQDLQHLVSEAHKREMKVVVEFVPGFVAKTSPLVSEKAAWMDTANNLIQRKILGWRMLSHLIQGILK
ncbi:alpha-amylase family glycosyl hydrolase [Paracerasibacillus soli]|uniref:Alpha-amylase family glycosyl hydrolase n=1 Tax=Paracerasibacillus soli TaxID=480284 RepID=A0ABU5CPQ1_9BACI|nr:alpha-amylase family glycosyl hydrolase [Virgibacillus soli]MDY0407861.1 alpha-amylase family glycosyl hydrolase [Virgibacillus soli]